MILSLSYDEYESWAERLRALQPANDILRGQLPSVRDMRERGHPWSDVMFTLATGYYNRNDPTHDLGRYGAGRSIVHLLLVNRKTLRLSRQKWAGAVDEYSALTHRICADALKRVGPSRVDEFLFIMGDALPLVREYVDSNPGDEFAAGTLASLQEVFDELGGAERVARPRDDPRQLRDAPQAIPDVVIASAIFVAGLVSILIFQPFKLDYGFVHNAYWKGLILVLLLTQLAQSVFERLIKTALSAKPKALGLFLMRCCTVCLWILLLLSLTFFGVIPSLVAFALALPTGVAIIASTNLRSKMTR